MAFNLSIGATLGSGNTGGQAPSAAIAGSSTNGPDLKEIVTEQIGFQSIAGEAKLQLLPTPWPTDALPAPSASLLSVASSRGLVAAAGPECVVIATTNSVRAAITKAGAPGDNVRTIDPDLKLQISRASHVAFSADESVLLVSPQSGGGLIAFSVDGLIGGRTEPALQIPTNGVGLRALVPNPVGELASLFAVVTTNGELLLADLKDGGLRNGPNGPVLKNGVSCLSWSNRGKQIVAGLADGAAAQIAPNGTLVAEIPRPPTLEGSKHVSAISWLANDTFFCVYTPNDTSTDGMIPQSDYYIISRQKDTANFAFQRLPEVVPPFGLDRLPSFQFIVRLRHFKPHILDLVLVASTTSGDIGVITSADAPLSQDEPVVDDFAYTLTNDDSRRAQLPLSQIDGDTSPIGVAIDLSCKETILTPIPSDPEILESATPVPSLLVLNHEGLLVYWWIVYSDSIREKTAYAGLVAAGEASQTRQESQSQTPEPTSAQTEPRKPAGILQPAALGHPGFGQSNFGSASPFARPGAADFGAPSTSSPGGDSSSFGAPSTLRGIKSSWTSTGFGSSESLVTQSGFGQPSFGSATPFGGLTAPSFGTASPIGSRPLSYGQAAIPSIAGQSAAPAGTGMGSKTPFGGGSSASPFTTQVGNDVKSSGFGKFAASSGFASVRPDQTTGPNTFAGTRDNSGLSTPVEHVSLETKASGSIAQLGTAKATQPANLFRTGDSTFKLTSGFKGDGTAKNDLSSPAKGSSFSFGSNLDDMLGDTNNSLSPTHDRETDMDESDAPLSPAQQEADNDSTSDSQLPAAPVSVITPPSTIMQSKATPAPPFSTIFGTGTQVDTTPAAVQNSKPVAVATSTTPAPMFKTFGTSMQQSTTPASVQDKKLPWDFTTPFSVQDKTLPHDFGPKLSTTPKESPIPKPLPFAARAKSPDKMPSIKAEAASDDETQDIANIPEAPLPPDPTSKTTFPAGDTSASSVNSKTPSDDAPLPPDFLPANKSATHEADHAELPEEGNFSSDYDEGSEEDASGDISPVEEEEEEEEASVDPAEQIETSPESSFGRGGDKSQEESPTGGLFTKVNTLKPSQKSTRPLFGEVHDGPVFPPPKPQESPRSPSPVRNVLKLNDFLRPEASRSVSAPPSRLSVIDTRKADLAKSRLGNQQPSPSGFRAQEEGRVRAAAEAKVKAEAEEAQQLVDDEDERLQAELARPVSPVQNLDAFLQHEQNIFDDGSKSGIPGQIERLYQDINAMIATLGINARSLSGFMLYQQSQEPNKDWPEVVRSATPMDSLNDEWVLDDVTRLQEGNAVLAQLLGDHRISGVSNKLQQCQDLLNKDLAQLKTKVISVRKIIHARSDAEAAFNAPLSAEQISLQHDLRKASTAVQTKLVHAEQNLTMLRAKLAEVVPARTGGLNGSSKTSLSKTSPHKKPTVEAVTNTIAKMTSMAEKKSTDIDVLEAQLKKMGLSVYDTNDSRQASAEANVTPQKTKGKLGSSIRTPGSTVGSVYHTPDSRFGNSTSKTPDTGRRSTRVNLNDLGASVSTEDKDRWREKAGRRKEVEQLLKEALAERRNKKKRLAVTSS